MFKISPNSPAFDNIEGGPLFCAPIKFQDCYQYANKYQVPGLCPDHILPPDDSSSKVTRVSSRIGARAIGVNDLFLEAEGSDSKSISGAREIGVNDLFLEADGNESRSRSLCTCFFLFRCGTGSSSCALFLLSHLVLLASLAVLERNEGRWWCFLCGMGGCLSFMCNYDILITCFFCINVSSFSLKYVRTLSSNIFKFFTHVMKWQERIIHTR